MAVSFPCKECGKILKVAGELPTAFKCPHCHKRIEVPAGLVSVSSPQEPPGPAGSEDVVGPDQQVPRSDRAEAIINALGTAMPFVISLLFHLGIALIMVFVTMYILESPSPEEMIFPDAAWSENPGGQMRSTDFTAPEARRATQVMERRHKNESRVSGRTDRRTSVIAAGGGGLGGGRFWKPGLPAAGGPRSSFLGSGGNAHHVVYVLDRSGSMLGIWDDLERQMLISISKLRAFQDFHVILFTGSAEPPPESGKPVVIEYHPKKLVPGTRHRKIDVAKFLQSLGPVQGPASDPVPALKRAFDVLRNANPRKPGKLLYLLTDAAFTADTQKVLQTIRQGNSNRSIMINTFLYGLRPPQSAVRFMEQIARENGGLYRYISPYD